MLPRAGGGRLEVAELFCAGGGDWPGTLAEVPEELPPVPGGSGFGAAGAGGLVVVVEGGKKAPGRGGDSGGVAAEPVDPEPVLEKLQVRMRC